MLQKFQQFFEDCTTGEDVKVDAPPPGFADNARRFVLGVALAAAGFSLGAPLKEKFDEDAFVAALSSSFNIFSQGNRGASVDRQPDEATRVSAQQLVSVYNALMSEGRSNYELQVKVAHDDNYQFTQARLTGSEAAPGCEVQISKHDLKRAAEAMNAYTTNSVQEHEESNLYSAGFVLALQHMCQTGQSMKRSGIQADDLNPDLSSVAWRYQQEASFASSMAYATMKIANTVGPREARIFAGAIEKDEALDVSTRKAVREASDVSTSMLEDGKSRTLFKDGRFIFDAAIQIGLKHADAEFEARKELPIKNGVHSATEQKAEFKAFRRAINSAMSEAASDYTIGRFSNQVVALEVNGRQFSLNEKGQPMAFMASPREQMLSGQRAKSWWENALLAEPEAAPMPAPKLM